MEPVSPDCIASTYHNANTNTRPEITPAPSLDGSINSVSTNFTAGQNNIYKYLASSSNTKPYTGPTPLASPAMSPRGLRGSVVLDDAALAFDDNPANSFEARTLSKVTWRIMPFLCLLFLLCFANRVNILNCKYYLLADRSLDVTEDQYTSAVRLFSITYIIFEIPSNLALLRFRPSRWFARIMVTWGLVSASMSLVTTAGGLYTVRLLLGAAEAGLFPGLICYLTRWYKKDERAEKISCFYVASALAGVLCSLLANEVLEMNAGGLAGWRWLFIFEGAPSVVVGVLVLFFLPDGPASCSWLTEAEKYVIISRLVDDRSRQHYGVDDTAVSASELKATLADPVLYAWGVIYVCQVVEMYSVARFLPVIIQEFGQFDFVTTTLLGAPCWLFAAFVTVLLAQRTNASGRFAHYTFLTAAVSTCWWLALLAASASVLEYVCMAFVAAFSWAQSAPFFAWVTTRLHSPTQFAAGIALVSCIGNMGAFLSPVLFQASDRDWVVMLVEAGVLLCACGLILGVELCARTQRVNAGDGCGLIVGGSDSSSSGGYRAVGDASVLGSRSLSEDIQWGQPRPLALPFPVYDSRGA